MWYLDLTMTLEKPAPRSDISLAQEPGRCLVNGTIGFVPSNIVAALGVASYSCVARFETNGASSSSRVGHRLDRELGIDRFFIV